MTDHVGVGGIGNVDLSINESCVLILTKNLKRDPSEEGPFFHKKAKLHSDFVLQVSFSWSSRNFFPRPMVSFPRESQQPRKRSKIGGKATHALLPFALPPLFLVQFM